MPQISVATRRLHRNRGRREPVMPLIMRAILPVVMAFGQLLRLKAKTGSTIPNRSRASPAAFSFAG